jgi:hypothetical protein
MYNFRNELTNKLPYPPTARIADENGEEDDVELNDIISQGLAYQNKWFLVMFSPILNGAKTH